MCNSKWNKCTHWTEFTSFLQLTCANVLCVPTAVACIMHDDRPYCIKDKVCALASETGPCDGAFTKYWFNLKTSQCEQMSYGGCGGNENRFDTVEECQKRCVLWLFWSIVICICFIINKYALFDIYFICLFMLIFSNRITFVSIWRVCMLYLSLLKWR
jgi:hypothetical protein